MSLHWDERYNRKEYVYGSTPNVFFENQLTDLKPGDILLPCEGEGRNALFAAQSNWNVVAFDSSEVGKNKAMALAAQNNVSYDYQILDISSSSKGVLPPKVVLTGRNGTSLPIASPTTGLFVYNTAEAGTVPNEVSPGFYFYNGTNWTRMDPEDWSIPESITIGAVTTAPTKGTIVYDKVSYRRTSTTSFEVTYNYSQSTAGTAGSGHYLFRLPGNLTFGSSILKTTSNTYETIVNRVIIGTGYYGDATGRFRPLGIIPYDNNRFRIMAMDNTTAGLIIGSSDIGLNTDGSSYKFSFILETN